MRKSKITQLTRSHEWWDHKTPHVLSFAYASALMGSQSLFQLLSPEILILFTGFVLIAIYASIINDLTDLKIDIACGKSNMMQHLAVPVRWILTLVSTALILAATLFIYPNLYAVTFYLSIALAISLYSFPPVRLKKRGIWGVVSCASAEHLFPVWFAIAVIFYGSSMKINWIWLAAAGSLSFLYGLRSILWHQFRDRDNDRVSGINTFANEVDPESFNETGKIIIGLELIALAAVLFMVNLWITYLFLGLYICFILLRKAIFKSKIIVIISPKNQHFQILMMDFYTIFFPLSLLLYASYAQPKGWLVLVIHVLLFHKPLITTAKDSYYLGRDLIRAVIR